MKAMTTLNIISEFKYSIKLAIPLIMSDFIYALNSFIATAMIAHLGKEQLAANAIVWSVYLAIIVFFAGIFYSVSIMVSQSLGAKDDTSVSICFKQGLIMAVMFSLPMMFALWNIPIILVWMHQEPEVVYYASSFFHVLAWSVLPFNISVIIQQFLMGINKTRLVMLLNIISVPIEIFFYYSFLFGKFGFPKMGLSGIGYGLLISYCAVAICGIFYLLFSRRLIKYHLFDKWWVVESRFLIEMIRIGLPMGFMWCSELVFFAVAAFMMGMLGTVTLAAYQISYQYLTIALIIIIAISKNVSVRAGYEIGSSNRDNLKLTIAVNLGISFMFMSLFCIFYLIFPKAAINLDMNINAPYFKEVAYEAASFFPAISVLLLTDCIRLISCGALRSLKDTKAQMIISIFGFWGIAFLGSYLLAFKFGFGGLGAWWGIVIGLFITGMVLLARLIYLIRRIDLVTLVTKKEKILGV